MTQAGNGVQWVDVLVIGAGPAGLAAAIAAVRREMGSARAAAGVAFAQCAIAWVVAFLVHAVGLLIGLA